MFATLYYVSFDLNCQLMEFFPHGYFSPSYNPTNKIAEKSSVEECIFDYIALHIEYRFNKNSLTPQLLFSVFSL